MRLVCGIQAAREAIRAHGARLERVLVEAGDSPQLAALARFASDAGAPVERVSRGELDRASRGARHQGVCVLAPELMLHPFESLTLPSDALVVALDELEDPQNFGAIIRSAVALGAHAIVFPEHRAAPLTPATFRASAGAVEHATLCRVRALPNALRALADDGFSVIGLDAAGESLLSAHELTGRVAIVVGAEGKGLRKPVKALCSAVVRLPMAGRIASLNASVAAAIALYEVVRQRSVDERRA